MASFYVPDVVEREKYVYIIIPSLLGTSFKPLANMRTKNVLIIMYR